MRIALCPNCLARGPFYEHLTTRTRIEVGFNEHGARCERFDGEAETIEQYNESGYECGTCGEFIPGPLMGSPAGLAADPDRTWGDPV